MTEVQTPGRQWPSISLPFRLHALPPALSPSSSIPPMRCTFSLFLWVFVITASLWNPASSFSSCHFGIYFLEQKNVVRIRLNLKVRDRVV